MDFGGTASGTEVFAGGLALAENFLGSPSGGTLEDTRVHSGGLLEVGANSIADDTTIDAGATMLAFGGFANTVSLAGTLYVGGGTPLERVVASAVTVSSGGEQIVQAFGSAFNTLVQSGGELELKSGGFVLGTEIAIGGGLVMSAGLDEDLTVDAGGNAAQFGGSTSGAFLAGDLYVLGGVASGVTVSAGGLATAANFLNASAGGTMLDLTVSSGGTAFVGAHGTISGGMVSSGGTQFALAGITSNVTVDGTEYVGGSLPGTPKSAPILSATASGTTVSSGGFVQVNANGSAVGIAVLSGGDIAVNGGAVSGLSLASGATLDLPRFAFGSAETLSFAENSSGSQGTLTVTSGGHSLSVVLLGQYMAAGFALANDAAGGTAVTYLPATSNIEIAAGHG
jgi:autotransporter passenger strand-loop-strand repeat protein